MKLGDVADVRETLQGKTGMEPEIEEHVIKNVAMMESEAEQIPSLRKGDWIGIWICIVASVLATIYVFAN